MVRPMLSRSLLGAALGGALLFGALPAAAAEPVAVVVDQTRILRLDRPAQTLVIGNPVIADVSLRDSQTAFLVGRSFGVTNFIALDSQGQEIANIQIEVTAAPGAMLKVSRGTAQFNYSCSPRCELALVPGDAVYEDLIGQVNAKLGQGLGASGGDQR